MTMLWYEQKCCVPLAKMGNMINYANKIDENTSRSFYDKTLTSSLRSADSMTTPQEGSNQHIPQSKTTRECNSPPKRDSMQSSSNASGGASCNVATTLSPEIVAGAFPPLGLSGPTNFVFSPGAISTSRSKSIQQGRYLSFLSSHFSNSATMSQLGRATASGSPIRTMGSGGGGGYGERRLCMIDMSPFWDHIRHADSRENKSSTVNSTNAPGMKCDLPILNPNVLMEQFATYLLNTSMSRSNGQVTLNDVSPKNPCIPTADRSTNQGSTMQGLDSAISLEERLRRERQRLHSSGVTQFSWTNTENDNRRQRSLSPQHPPLHLETKPPNANTAPPYPEQRLSPRSSTPTIKDDEKNCLNGDGAGLKILVPFRGNIYIQDGVGPNSITPLRQLYDKSMLEEVSSRTKYVRGRQRGNLSHNSSNHAQEKRSNGSIIGRDTSAIDPQLSPDGTMVAFVVAGEIYVIPSEAPLNKDDDDGNFERRNDSDSRTEMSESNTEVNYGIDNLNERAILPTRVTFGAVIDGACDDCNSIRHFPEHDDTDDEDLRHMAPQQSNLRKQHGCSITHGLADFVAQEEMDRYRGFWWDTKSRGILFARVDESSVPPFRIMHHGAGVNDVNYEDHRYPFAGQSNPDIMLGYVRIDRKTVLGGNINNTVDEIEVREKQERQFASPPSPDSREIGNTISAADRMARHNWSCVKWFKPPPEASEYLTRVSWLPDGDACIQWQDRIQCTLILEKVCVETGERLTIHKEESGLWINLHHMFQVLSRPIDPRECLCPEESQGDRTNTTLPEGSFSFLFASERTGFCHIYLYTYIPGDERATLVRSVSAGEWVVDSIAGVDMLNSVVYVTGTFDSPLEKHLYALPLINPNVGDSPEKTSSGLGVRRGFQNMIHSLSGASSIAKVASKFHNKDDGIFGAWAHPTPVLSTPPPDPIRLTKEPGMHSIVMDEACRLIVDTSSDLNRPTSTKIYYMPLGGPFQQIGDSKTASPKLMCVPYDSTLGVNAMPGDVNSIIAYRAPELLSFPTSDGNETLYAALYKPDPAIHGPGPYALICAVYGGPHVQRVSRSWCQSADMRVQQLCSLGFAVVKCDNRGSARRGLAFEGAIKKHLGRFEVLDQVTAVRHLVMKGVADPARVGIYGWSYGGYLAAMCLCRAPDVFQVGIAGAPVTSWEGYDTHYTERYMGLPNENSTGYREAAVFEHVSKMNGKLLIVHGLIDENVHFRHTARLINRLIAAGKDYDILIFPDERHSPRKLRDRLYMEKRMSDYFVEHLRGKSSKEGLRFMPGHL